MYESIKNLAFVCVKTFSLQQVTLSTESDHVFQWTKEQCFESGDVLEIF